MCVVLPAHNSTSATEYQEWGVRGAMPAGLRARAPSWGADMAQGTILVVDDSPLATKIMSTLFTREGYDVLTAGSGEEALEHLGRVTPDLVVTDIMMPGIDGYELCHQIRVRPHLRGIPVLAITTVNELEAKLRGVEVGVDDFVPKNTPAQELLARVEALLTRRGPTESLPPPSPDAPRRTGRVVAFFSLKGGC